MALPLFKKNTKEILDIDNTMKLQKYYVFSILRVSEMIMKKKEGEVVIYHISN
jgi:hypothetical protein